jgi:hypothetical protein
VYQGASVDALHNYRDVPTIKANPSRDGDAKPRASRQKRQPGRRKEINGLALMPPTPVRQAQTKKVLWGLDGTPKRYP